MEEALWNNIDNKVRRLVKELIEPTVKRAQEAKDVSEKLLKKSGSITERITSVEIMIAQNNQRVQEAGSLSARITETEAYARSVDYKTAAETDKLQQKLDLVILDILNLSEKFGVFDKQREKIEETASTLEQSLLQTKLLIETSVDLKHSTVVNKLDSFESSMRTTDSNIRQLSRKIDSISSELSETDFLAKKSERLTSDYSEKFSQISKILINNKKELQDTIEKVRNSVFGQYKEFIESTKKIFKYLENDYKVAMNMSMIEHLYSTVADQHAMNRLAEYEKEKLEEWSGYSLQATLKDSIEKSKSRCQKLIETPIRVEEEIYLASSKESIYESLEVSHKSRSIQGDFHSEVSVDPPEVSESIEITISQAPALSKSPMAASHKSFARNTLGDSYQLPYSSRLDAYDYMPHISDLQQQITDLKSSISSNSSLLHTLISDQKQTFDTSISTITKTQKDFIDQYTNKSKELEFLIQEASHECFKVSNLRKRDLSDINSVVFEQAQKIEGFIERHAKYEDESEELKKKMTTIIELCRITIALQQQDEVDRDSIALMATKECKPPSRAGLKKNVISIDKNCFSCNGQNNTVFTAFKMACLTYTPSPVMHLKQIFSRKELIDIQKRMVEGIVTFGYSNDISNAIEEKQRVRAKSAFGVRRSRPQSGPFTSGNNPDAFTSIGSEAHRRF